MAQSLEQNRLHWVDVAKGVCIILVVMMHSTLGVERAIGTETSLHAFIEWARPFRMPDFFLISGLFLAARIDRPWRPYLDTKVAHFAYFYVLWVNIQFAMKAPGMVREAGLDAAVANYLLAYVQPFGTLWFIYLLALFFIATKLVRAGLGRALAYCGQHSIVIYLAFALFMGPTRALLLKLAVLPLDAVALTVTTVGVLGALALRHLVRDTRLSFLFVRPAAFKLH